MSASERVREFGRGPATPFRTDALAFDYVDASAARCPSAVAVREGGASISYGALVARANRIAGALRARGVGEDDVVALCLPRSLDAVAGMLGIWKAGGVLLPLDPDFPAARLAYMAGDAGAKAVLTRTGVDASWRGPAPLIHLDADIPSEGPAPAIDRARMPRAYLFYTSGSTGAPKGVENSHRALANFTEAMLREPGLGAGDRVLAGTTISFDVMLLELFVPLAAGAEIVVADRAAATGGAALAAMIAAHGVTVLQGTPATWRLLLEAGWEGAPSLKALCGGEAMPADIAREIPPRVRELWNMYGPTETTVWSSCAKIADADAIHVGRPIANTTFHILNADGSPVDIGAEGDLWIGGEGVALAYRGRPEETAARFRPDPQAPGGGRRYDTGDRARWRPDGAVEIVGRADDQIKLRGNRIEPGEIEAALLAHPAVAAAAAAARPDYAGEPALVAYVVFAPGAAATTSELRAFVKASLPDYMTPQFFVPLPALPLTANRKVDRKALPALAPGAVRTGTAPAQSAAERRLAAIWAEILGTEDILPDDNFFDLGGQSLQTARMAGRVREAFGATLTTEDVMFRTLAQIAAAIDAECAA